jgi:hypothetical protein
MMITVKIDLNVQINIQNNLFYKIYFLRTFGMMRYTKKGDRELILIQ